MRSFGGGWGRLGLGFGFVAVEVVRGSGVVETEREVVVGSCRDADSAGVAGFLLVGLLVEASVMAPLSSASRSPTWSTSSSSSS